MSVCKSDEKLLIFASLISSSVLKSFCLRSMRVVFFMSGKHARRIFNSLLSVSSGDETLRLMLDIMVKTSHS